MEIMSIYIMKKDGYGKDFLNHQTLTIMLSVVFNLYIHFFRVLTKLFPFDVNFSCFFSLSFK